MDLVSYLLGGLVVGLVAGASFAQKADHRDVAVVLLGLAGVAGSMGMMCYALDWFWRKDAAAIAIAKESLTILPPSSPVPTPIPAARPADMPPIPEDAVTFFLGSAYVWSRSLPHTIFRDRGKPMLTIDRSDRGQIKVSGTFFSADGTLLGQLVKNQFFPNDKNAELWRVAMADDAGGMELLDRQGEVIISVKSLNKKAIKILGKYHLRNGFPVFIEEERQKFGPMTTSGGTELPNQGGTFEIR